MPGQQQRIRVYLQRHSETDLLSVVTEDAPRSTEEDEADPLLRLKDLPLWTETQTITDMLHLLSSVFKEP